MRRKIQFMVRIVSNNDGSTTAEFQCAAPGCKKWHTVSKVATAFLEIPGINDKWRDFIKECMQAMIVTITGDDSVQAAMIDLKEFKDRN
jgi:hypothetical protein